MLLEKKRMMRDVRSIHILRFWSDGVKVTCNEKPSLLFSSLLWANAIDRWCHGDSDRRTKHSLRPVITDHRSKMPKKTHYLRSSLPRLRRSSALSMSLSWVLREEPFASPGEPPLGPPSIPATLMPARPAEPGALDPGGGVRPGTIALWLEVARVEVDPCGEPEARLSNEWAD